MENKDVKRGYSKLFHLHFALYNHFTAHGCLFLAAYLVNCKNRKRENPPNNNTKLINTCYACNSF